MVITKTDALRDTAVGAELDDSPDKRREWLERHGLSDAVHDLGDFGVEVGYFASGLDGLSVSGEPGQDKILEILDWCSSPESAVAKRLSPVFSRLVGSNARKPQPSKEKEKEKEKERKIPLSYRVGRLVLFGGQMAAVVAVPLLVLAFLDWLGL